METEKIHELIVDRVELQSRNLKRSVTIDFYVTEPDTFKYHLLLVNDGQDLVTMNFAKVLSRQKLKPLIVVGIHCGADRKNEYGMISGPDHKGWGVKAGLYEKFIINELLPLIGKRYQHVEFTSRSFAGFSLGALSAFDMTWQHPEVFNMTAVFSGSLWWRSVDKEEKDFDPWKHRMMHKQVAESDVRKGMKFFFECGELDESEDRNKNGVIDSIDDTIDLMRLLIRKGHREGKDVYYLQMPEGKHDVASWAKAFPAMLNIFY